MNLKTIVTSKPSSPIISNSKHFLSPDTQTHVCTRTEQCLECDQCRPYRYKKTSFNDVMVRANFLFAETSQLINRANQMTGFYYDFNICLISINFD